VDFNARVSGIQAALRMESKPVCRNACVIPNLTAKTRADFTRFCAKNHNHRHFATPMAVKFFRHRQFLRRSIN
jgi:hypothetical protein